MSHFSSSFLEQRIARDQVNHARRESALRAELLEMTKAFQRQKSLLLRYQRMLVTALVVNLSVLVGLTAVLLF